MESLLFSSKERQQVKSQAVPKGAGSACHKLQVALLLLEALLSSLEQESLGAKASPWCFLLHFPFSFK